MRHESSWSASKYAVRGGRLVPSRDQQELAPSSRLFASIIGEFYNDVVPQFASGALLDLGCGKQPLYGLYEGYVDRVVAVDWPGSLHRSGHLDAFCDVSMPLPFAPESFDTVLSSDVLEHLPDPVTMFREVARVLRPGGVLLLNTPFLYPVHEAPHDYLRHTRFSLLRLCREVGLEVTVLDPLGGALDVLVDTVSKLVGKFPGGGGDGGCRTARTRDAASSTAAVAAGNGDDCLLLPVGSWTCRSEAVRCQRPYLILRASRRRLTSAIIGAGSQRKLVRHTKFHSISGVLTRPR